MKEKKIKEYKSKSLLSKIINIVLWCILIVWIGICLIDFYRVHESKKPIFCIKSSTVKYNDGKVDSYFGLGYKVIDYKRDSYKAIEYGPFFIKDKTAKEK